LLQQNADAGSYVVSLSPPVPGIEGKTIWADSIGGALDLVEEMLIERDVCGPNERVPRLWRRITAIVTTFDCTDQPKSIFYNEEQ
jgi:hypothetical protein